MSKSYYSDYAKHCLRFYVRHPNPRFHSMCDRRDWESAEGALHALSAEDRDFLMEVYRAKGGKFEDRAKEIAERMDYRPKNRIWKTISRIERDVAKRRGLI